MMHQSFYEYLESNDEKLFTICLLPKACGKFPIVISRSPYVKHTVDMPEEKIVQEYYNNVKPWLDHGYAMLFSIVEDREKVRGHLYLIFTKEKMVLRFENGSEINPFIM